MAYVYWGTGGIGYGTGTPPTLSQGTVFASADTGILYIGPVGGGSPTPVGGGATLPAGIIVLWSGLLSAIPSGWLLCDGTNGTPDLRDRFITGAANGANPGTTGGSNTHTHADHTVTQPTISGSTGAGTAHTHTANWPAGVPTAANESAHTHAAGAISWPAGVPTHSGTTATFSGNALGTHAHELPFQIPTTTTTRQIAAATFGTGTSRAATAVSATGTANTTSAAVALSQAVTAGTPAGTVNITSQGTVAWPAGVPTGATSGAGSAHTHTIAWPAGVPTNANESAHTHPVGTLAASGTATSAHSTANNVPLFYALAFLMKAA